MKQYLCLLSSNTKWKCMGIITLTLINALLSSVWPVRLREIYTSISSGDIRSAQQGLLLIVRLGIIYLGAECLLIVRRLMLECIISSHEVEIRASSVEKLLKMPVAYCAGWPSAERTAQLSQGIVGLSQLIKTICNEVFATIMTTLFTLTQVLLTTHWLIGCIILMYLACTLIISIFQIRSQNGIREKIVAQKTSLEGQISESITNLELIRGMNAEQYEKRRLYPSILQVSKTENYHHRYMGKFDCFKQVCKIIFQMSILMVGILMTLQGNMSASAVITSCLLSQQLTKPIDDVYRIMDETASSVVKAKVLLEVMINPQDIAFDLKGDMVDGTDNSILLDNVIITNPCEKQEDAKQLAWYDHLVIPTNCRVALQGPTGSGKTTMIRAIKRFYPYVQGNIKLFGQPLESYSQSDLANQICYIPQCTFFFIGSIRDNLSYSLNMDIKDSQLLDALSQACLLNELARGTNESIDVLALPVDEGGKNFSGGQRQRLALARAFLRTPRLYLLDESTANLYASTADHVLSNI